MQKRSKSTENLSGKYRSTEDLSIPESLSDDEGISEHKKRQAHQAKLKFLKLPAGSEKYRKRPFVEKRVNGFPDGVRLDSETARLLLDQIVKEKGTSLFFKSV